MKYIQKDMFQFKKSNTTNNLNDIKNLNDTNQDLSNNEQYIQFNEDTPLEQSIHTFSNIDLDTNDDNFLDSLNDDKLPNEIRFKPQNNNSDEQIMEQQIKQARQIQNNYEFEEDNFDNQSDQSINEPVDEIDPQKEVDMLHDYILTGQITQAVKIMDVTWYMHIITVQESNDVIKRAEAYSPESQQLAQVLLMLSYAVDKIDNYQFTSFEETRSFLEQLAIPILYRAIEQYNDLFAKQAELVNKPHLLRSMVQNDFLRIKYQVMKNTGLVPSDERARQMNDIQWLWYYYNMDEDLEQTTDIRQSELDYLGVFINPKMAQEMIKVNEKNRKKRQLDKKRMYSALNKPTKKSVSNVNNSQESILDDIYGPSSSSDVMDSNTVVNTEFEKELQAALNADKSPDDKPVQFVELFDDDESAGNPYESEEDFMERVRAFLPFAGTNYGYVKPKKFKFQGFNNRPQEQDIQEQLNDPDTTLKGKALIDNSINDQHNTMMKDIQQRKNMPKWKQESDQTFLTKTGIPANQINQYSQNIDKEKEIEQLSDNMDFFSIDDE